MIHHLSNYVFVCMCLYVRIVGICLVGPGFTRYTSDPCVCFFFFQSHKDKIRQKERHKKSSDSLSSSVTTSTIEKVQKANTQGDLSTGHCKVATEKTLGATVP